MYLVNLEAHPKPDSEAYGTVSGAQAVCWVDTHDPDEAERRSRLTLAEAGWDTEEVNELRRITRDEFVSAQISLDRFDQALTDGIVVSLHTWPVGAPDE
jgi:hypothetical protein